MVQVVQGTIRDLANQVFQHLHQLDLKFHLSRQTGAINRITDRGSRGINFILSSMVSPLYPCLVSPCSQSPFPIPHSPSKPALGVPSNSPYRFNTNPYLPVVPRDHAVLSSMT